LQGVPLDNVECPMTQVFIGQPAHTHHQTRADKFQKTIQRIQDGNQRDKRHKGRHGPAGQHPVVDLQHEQRPGQHQQIRYEAEHASRDERGAPLCQRSANTPAALRTCCRHVLSHSKLGYATGQTGHTLETR
jgi:hypothetical protein